MLGPLYLLCLILKATHYHSHFCVISQKFKNWCSFSKLTYLNTNWQQNQGLCSFSYARLCVRLWHNPPPLSLDINLPKLRIILSKTISFIWVQSPKDTFLGQHLFCWLALVLISTMYLIFSTQDECLNTISYFTEI